MCVRTNSTFFGFTWIEPSTIPTTGCARSAARSLSCGALHPLQPRCTPLEGTRPTYPRLRRPTAPPRPRVPPLPLYCYPCAYPCLYLTISLPLTLTFTPTLTCTLTIFPVYPSGSFTAPFTTNDNALFVFAVQIPGQARLGIPPAVQGRLAHCLSEAFGFQVSRRR